MTTEFRIRGGPEGEPAAFEFGSVSPWNAAPVACSIGSGASIVAGASTSSMSSIRGPMRPFAGVRNRSASTVAMARRNAHDARV